MRYRPVNDALNFNAKEMTDIWQADDITTNLNNNNSTRLDSDYRQGPIRMDDSAGLMNN